MNHGSNSSATCFPARWAGRTRRCCNSVGYAVIIEISCTAVDLRLTGAVLDCDGKPHTLVRRSGCILCKICANTLRIPCILNKKWCAVQVSNLRPLTCEGNALPLS